jgi:type I restriction enzyme S subunit
MDLSTFFQKFDQFADAPDAVAKLRELVLELAATGRLVPSILERPFAEDTKLMGTLVELVMGQAPAGTECNTEGRGTVFVKVGEFGPLYPREEVWTTNPLKFAKKGDVLVCVVGATVGKLNLAIDCAIGRSAAAIRPSSALDTKFLYYSLIPYTLRLRRNSRGSAQGVIGKVELNAVSLWVPSREVQKRIVAKVDELMALCDRLEAQQKERETRHAALACASLARFAEAPTPANLEWIFHPSYAIPPADLRKAILTLAVQGKLVAQDPSEEPAEDLVARVAATKLRLQKTGQIGKEKPVEPLQPESLPFEAPESWQWAKLAELTELITKGSSPKWQGIAYVSESEGILFITSENVGNYVLRKLDDLKYVSRGFNEIEPRSILKRGDILMNLVGASIGRTALYNLHDGANINQAVALIRLVRETDGVCPRFLLHYLNSPAAIDYMLSSRVVNAQPNISLTDAREFAVPLPPLAEQRRIVAKVDQLMALVDALETQLAAGRATATSLLSALVAALVA